MPQRRVAALGAQDMPHNTLRQRLAQVWPSGGGDLYPRTTQTGEEVVLQDHLTPQQFAAGSLYEQYLIIKEGREDLCLGKEDSTEAWRRKYPSQAGRDPTDLELEEFSKWPEDVRKIIEDAAHAPEGLMTTGGYQKKEFESAQRVKSIIKERIGGGRGGILRHSQGRHSAGGLPTWASTQPMPLPSSTCS